MNAHEIENMVIAIGDKERAIAEAKKRALTLKGEKAELCRKLGEAVGGGDRVFFSFEYPVLWRVEVRGGIVYAIDRVDTTEDVAAAIQQREKDKAAVPADFEDQDVDGGVFP